MTISILQKLTISKLIKIANENNIDVSSAKNKSDYILILRKSLPADFNFEPYLNNTTKKTDEVLNTINSSQSLSAFIPTANNTNNKTEQDNKNKTENKNNTKDDLISALFDVTNFEPKKPSPSIKPDNNQSFDKGINTPSRKVAPYRPRFGPSAKISDEASNKPTISEINNTQDIFNKQNKNTQKQNLPLYRQAYTSPPRNENYRSSYYKNENSSELSLNKRPAVPTSTYYHDDSEQMPLPLDKEILEDIVLNDESGYLEIFPNGYGFLRKPSFTASSSDVYVSSGLIQKHNLKNGDFIIGKSSNKKEGMKYSALLYIEYINNSNVKEITKRIDFDDLTPIYPNRKIVLDESTNNSLTMRMIDFIVPIGFGQRGLLISPPRSGASTLLLEFANTVLINNNDVDVLYILIDCEPEMVTEIKENTKAEVFYSTFDKPQETQIKVTELVFERAKRLVEEKRDVIILLDSINKLAQAYQTINNKNNNLFNSNSATITKLKQLFSFARNIREGGSLTIICNFENELETEINSMLYEEFLDKSNAVLELDSYLSQRYLFPAINVKNSYVKKPELFLPTNDVENFRHMRSILSNIENPQIVEQLMEIIINTKDNKSLRKKLPEWLSLINKK